MGVDQVLSYAVTTLLQTGRSSERNLIFLAPVLKNKVEINLCNITFSLQLLLARSTVSLV